MQKTNGWLAASAIPPRSREPFVCGLLQMVVRRRFERRPVCFQYEHRKPGRQAFNPRRSHQAAVRVLPKGIAGAGQTIRIDV